MQNLQALSMRQSFQQCCFVMKDRETHIFDESNISGSGFFVNHQKIKDGGRLTPMRTKGEVFAA